MYVDGFVLRVKKRQLEAYERIAKAAKKYYKKAGALDYVEAVSDDVSPHCGVSFPKAVKARKDEVVVFSWVSWKTKAARDEANANMLTDPDLAASLPKDGVMPFDMDTMVLGGFKAARDLLAVAAQLLVTFKDDAPEAMVQAWVLTQRRHADVARVELMTEVETKGIIRRPSQDEHADTTVRGEAAFVKAPDGALLERLTPQAKDVVDLLLERARAGLGPIESQKSLLAALQAFRPERWRSRKVQTATTAYAAARDRLVSTGWDLTDEPGEYAFRRAAGGA